MMANQTKAGSSEPITAMVSETLRALSTLDEQHLESLSDTAEALRGRGTGIPLTPRVAQAAAREVQALRELMRFTSQRLTMLETMHRERLGGSDPTPVWRSAWAR